MLKKNGAKKMGLLILFAQKKKFGLIRLNNLKTILPYIQQRPVIVETTQYEILKLLSHVSRISIESIEHQMTGVGRQRIRETIYQMIYRGMLGSTIELKPLDSKTEVWNNAQEKMD